MFCETMKVTTVDMEHAMTLLAFQIEMIFIRTLFWAKVFGSVVWAESFMEDAVGSEFVEKTINCTSSHGIFVFFKAIRNFFSGKRFMKRLRSLQEIVAIEGVVFYLISHKLLEFGNDFQISIRLEWHFVKSEKMIVF